MGRRRRRYKRVLLKISGEALQGDGTRGIDYGVLENVSRQVREVHGLGVEIALVIGGGNIIRGSEEAKHAGLDRASADYMGMLSTVINALALQVVLEKLGAFTTQFRTSGPMLPNSRS